MPLPSLRTGRSAWLVAVAVVTAGLVAGCSGSQAVTDGSSPVVRAEDASGPYSGVVLDAPYDKPPVELVDTDGRPYTPARDAKDPVTLVFFGFTSCTEECPAMLANVASALHDLEPEVRSRIGVVFVSTDPKRDTPRAVRRFLDQFDPSFVGLTGRPEALESAAASLGVALTGVTRLPGGGYDVGHSSQLIGFAPDGLGRVVWPPDSVTVPGLRADLRRLVGETRGPFPQGSSS